MAHYINGYLREKLEEAGYISIQKTSGGMYILTDADGKRELWHANKHYAGYGIVYKNTVLEFVRDA